MAKHALQKKFEMRMVLILPLLKVKVTPSSNFDLFSFPLFSSLLFVLPSRIHVFDAEQTDKRGRSVWWKQSTNPTLLRYR